MKRGDAGMNSDVFVQYLNNDDVHDGSVRRVIEEADRTQVLVDTVDGRVVVFEFTGVRDLNQNRPEGTVLYSFTELRESLPLRRFCFTNWDEEDDAYLEITALTMTKREGSMDSAPEN